MVSLRKWLSLAAKGAKKLAVIAAVASAVAPSVSACADNTVHDMYTALDTSGFRRRTEFYTDTTNIYCLGAYAATRNDITFNAVARLVTDKTEGYAGTLFDRSNSIIAVGELAPGISRGTLQFTISPPKPDPTSMDQGVQPFPVGTYRCEFYVDSLPPASTQNTKQKYDPCGREATCIQFEVKYPDCPVAYAQSSVRCGGFFKKNATCHGQATQMCTCPDSTPSAAWSCQ